MRQLECMSCGGWYPELHVRAIDGLGYLCQSCWMEHEAKPAALEAEARAEDRPVLTDCDLGFHDIEYGDGVRQYCKICLRDTAEADDIDT